MIVERMEIPEAAVTAARAAIKGTFRLEDIRDAVAGALHDAGFDYGAHDRHKLNDRIADRILQAARRAGTARHAGAGRWTA